MDNDFGAVWTTPPTPQGVLTVPIFFLDNARMPQHDPLSCVAVLDAAELLGVSHTTIYRLAERGELKLTKVANRTVVRRTEIERFLEANTAA